MVLNCLRVHYFADGFQINVDVGRGEGRGEAVRGGTGKKRSRQVQKMQVPHRKGHRKDREASRESVLRWQNESLASLELSVRGVRQTKGYHQENRRSRGRCKRLAGSVRRGQNCDSSKNRGV